MRSTDVLTDRRKQLWNLIRLFVPRRMRWFYEGHPGLRGQLWYAERKLIYNTVREIRPKSCFEIGTWRGGGSTLFISQALKENGHGVLHTVEIDREFYDNAVRNYAEFLPHLKDHVSFHFGDYRQVYKPLLDNQKSIDFLILDGAEDGRQTLEQYDFFKPYLKPGTVLLVHDWFTEKTKFVKTIIENNVEWEMKATLVPPKSVGLVVAVKR